MQALIDLPQCLATEEPMENAEGTTARRDQPAQGRVLLFVHAAGHEEALQVLQQAKAEHGIAIRTRCASLRSFCNCLTDTLMACSHIFREEGDADRIARG
jgi:hypothetical protein